MKTYYVANIPFDDGLFHHGIKGQKWGIRRYQNEDGSLTSEGLARLKSSGQMQRALNKNEKEYAYSVGDAAKARRSADRLSFKMEKLSDRGKESSNRYARLENKYNEKVNSQKMAEARQKTLESNAWKIIGKASNKGYSTIISDKMRSGVRSGESFANILLLGGIGAGLRQVYTHGMSGANVDANKYNVKNDGKGIVISRKKR